MMQWLINKALDWLVTANDFGWLIVIMVMVPWCIADLKIKYSKKNASPPHPPPFQVFNLSPQGYSGPLEPVQSPTIRNIESMTKVEYDALEKPDDGTVYLVTGGMA